MILFDAPTLQRYTEAGAWGSETLFDLLRQRAAQMPDALALVDAPDKPVWADTPVLRLRWREVLAGAEAIAWALAQQGLRRDDVLMAQLPNSAEFVLLHLACARLGVVLSPVHVQQRAHELARVAEQSGARAIVSLRRIAKSDQLQLLRDLDQRLAQPLPVLWCDALLAAGAQQPPSEITAALDALNTAAPVGANDLHTICWTSGTEGTPKGVPRSHNNWLCVARRIITGAALQPGDVLLNPFPLVAVAGLTVLVPWLLLGGRLVQHQPANLTVLLAQIRDERAHYVCIAPALLNRLLNEAGLVAPGDLQSLRVIGSGSGPLDAWTIREFKSRHGIDIVNFYGSNEGLGLTAGPHQVPDAEQRAVLFPAAGRPGSDWGNGLSAHAVTRLRDPASGADIDAPGQAGELVVKGPTVFPGYWKATPEQTARSFTADGFFRTGDLFSLEIDAEGRQFYRFSGRHKDIVIRGGMKISPEELDALVIGHPLLREAAFCGYRDAVMGEKIGVVVVPQPGHVVALADIVSHLRGHGVASYKLPEALVQAEALPRNALNKILRRELQPLFDGVATLPPQAIPA